ncbi:NAD(P)H-quinone oxidoreductase [Alkalibacterium sp. MB6]|uniref:NAD(P)H-quinone oxidoreductase n=1 Tax=Alkalibacterium sp. MB6 TaxID=2081965 RepID=UPI0013793D1C|nr:NAD(P)H-quinone oxidoreductase [Alkalibacterium sp. MB6]
MKVWTVNEPGSRDNLLMEEQSKPIPKEGELLIEVKAAGVNRTDIMTRQNTSLTAPYPILGVEVSGIVVENNSPDATLKPGTRVAGLVNRGGYAEYVIIPANRAIVLPDSLTMEEGAAIPEVFLTAYQTLYWLGELKEKERVLIHAAGSGVGTAAIQLAKTLSHATVFATAGQEKKLEFARELGADYVINYKENSFDEIVLDQTKDEGVDVILDFVGASYWKKNYASAAFDSRWVLIGTLGGTHVENVSLIDLMVKRIALKGTLLTPRSDDYKAKLTKEFEKRAMPLFEKGQLKPVIHSVVPFSEVNEAHRQMEDNENIGKIIIKVADD